MDRRGRAAPGAGRPERRRGAGDRPDHADLARCRPHGAARTLGAGPAIGGSGAQWAAAARPIRRRQPDGIEPGHAWREVVRGDHQSAAVSHSGRGCRDAPTGGGRRRAGDRPRDEPDAVRRSPRGGRRAGRAVPEGSPALHGASHRIDSLAG
ncbi:hypothetical protein G6F57_020833 [Rhizopus arrhizus]|nr:hypothetical protein G6F57_020833 [Rhizopus arrhizus]